MAARPGRPWIQQNLRSLVMVGRRGCYENIFFLLSIKAPITNIVRLECLGLSGSSPISIETHTSLARSLARNYWLQDFYNYAIRGGCLSVLDCPDTYLPPFCALPRELGEYDLLLRVLLLVLFAAGLYEKGIRCHAPPWFIVLHGPAVDFGLNRIVLHLHVCLILWGKKREDGC